MTDEKQSEQTGNLPIDEPKNPDVITSSLYNEVLDLKHRVETYYYVLLGNLIITAILAIKVLGVL